MPVKTAVDLQPLQTRCVVIHFAMNRSRRVSVALTLMAVLATQRCSVLERSFCFGKFCGSSAFRQRLAVLLVADFNTDLGIYILCQNKINSTTLKQMARVERLNP